jgi:hypothetical protein
MNSMKQSNELARNSALNTPENDLPDEYLERAHQLIEERKRKEEEMRSALSPMMGRDDRLSGRLYQLDMQLRKDIAALRAEYGL